MSTEIHGFNLDIDHPAVGAISVFSKQAGYISIKKLDEHLKAQGIPDSLLPRKTESGSIFLQRAMQDVIKKDKTKKLQVVGKKSKIEVHLLNVHENRLSLEQANNDGLGVADSILSAKLKMNPHTKEEEVVLFPHGNEYEDKIQERFDFHTKHYKCSEDLSLWMSRTVMNHHKIQAVPRPGNTGGVYYIPKGEGFDLVVKLRNVMNDINVTYGHQLVQGVRIYLVPMITTFPDVVDALTDSLIDNFEKECAKIDEYLLTYEEGDAKLQSRGIESKLEAVDQLAKRLDSFQKSCGVSVDDLTPRLTALKVRLGTAAFQLAG